MADYKRQGSIDDENFLYLADSSNEARKDMSDNMNTDFVNLQTGIANALTSIENTLKSNNANLLEVLNNILTYITSINLWCENLDNLNYLSNMTDDNKEGLQAIVKAIGDLKNE